MNHFIPLLKREFLGYFRSPVAYVFIVVFLIAATGCTFFLGRLYESNQAGLGPFFVYLPWLMLVLVPAVGMRLWAEERRSGTIELLFTLPVTMEEAVLAKFTAGWLFLGIALVLTFPLVLTVNYLGDPDNGVILAGYLSCFLLAGTFLAVASFTSAFTKNQVIAFILGVVICFILVLLGWGVFTEMLSVIFPVGVVDFIAGLGVMPHFQSGSRGVIDLRDVVYFLTLMGAALALCVFTLQTKKGE